MQGQHYQTNQIGTFGITASDSLAWLNGTPNGFGAANQYSVRFTAMETITVDRVFQRITGLGGQPITVEIRNDNGSGNPGSLLNSVTFTPTNPGDSIQSAIFGATTLNAGSVYHVLTRGGNAGALYRGGGTNPGLRPYDRAVDTNLTLLRSNDSGASWSDQAEAPYFFFANGSDTSFVAGRGHA